MNPSPTIALALGLALTPVALACIHGPKDYEGKFHQERQQALAVFDGGQEDLFLSPTVVFDGPAPTEIAWVIPVPSVPSHYAEAKDGAMRELIQRYRDLTEPRMESDSLEDSPSNGARSQRAPLELLEAQVAGDYTIQPIKAHGEAGAAALVSWLSDNGFGVVPAENMRYYVEREWVWLCVKAAPKGQRSALKPLQITFATPRIVYPLKFSTHQGTFGLELFVVTRADCPKIAEEARAFGMLRHTSVSLELPPATAASLNGAKLSGQVRVIRLTHDGLSGKTIQGWPEDFSLTPAP